MPDGTVVKQVVYLNQVINHPRIEVGDYSYYHHFEILDDYAAFLAPYLFPLSTEKLIIGRFCQIAHGVRIITSSANHDMRGFSTYPFKNFMMSPEMTENEIKALFMMPQTKGDTKIGNDVWVGMNAIIMPGVTIGDGAIIGSGSLVVQDVEPYSVVGGNPAKILKKRFDHKTINMLLKIKWWNWSIEKIEQNLETLQTQDIEQLSKYFK